MRTHQKTCSFLLIALLVVSGCLQPVAPVPPDLDSLEAKISNALLQERQAKSALANQVALTPVEADQKSLWLGRQDAISSKAADDIAKAIKAELSAAKTPEEIADVWREVANGYAK